MKHLVRTEAQALAYITDCTLATISDMAMKKSRSKGEFLRQMGIAKTAIDWMVGMGVDFSSTRAKDVVECGSVENWAMQFMPEYK